MGRMICLRAMILLVLLMAAANSAYACAVPVSPSRQDEFIRRLINSADHVFIGQVQGIKRRRWGPDDERDPVASLWHRRAQEGRKVPGYLKNIADFSDATATLKVVTRLKSPDVQANSQNRSNRRRREPVVIDLLRPFRVAGHGPCMNFPRTCAWDIKPGQFVAVAIQETQYQPWRANVCLRLDRKNRPDARQLRDKLKTSSLADVLWPYVEIEKERMSQSR